MATARFLGRFTTAVANEVGEAVADLYEIEIDGDAKATAEIEEVA